MGQAKKRVLDKVRLDRFVISNTRRDNQFFESSSRRQQGKLVLVVTAGPKDVWGDEERVHAGPAQFYD